MRHCVPHESYKIHPLTHASFLENSRTITKLDYRIAKQYPIWILSISGSVRATGAHQYPFHLFNWNLLYSKAWQMLSAFLARRASGGIFYFRKIPKVGRFDKKSWRNCQKCGIEAVFLYRVTCIYSPIDMDPVLSRKKGRLMWFF